MKEGIVKLIVIVKNIVFDVMPINVAVMLFCLMFDFNWSVSACVS